MFSNGHSLPSWLADATGECSQGELIVNDEPMPVSTYMSYHQGRLAFTWNKLRSMGGSRIIEIGGHPWVMTACLAEDPSFDLVATVSAEEVSDWPDDIGVTSRMYSMVTPTGRKVSFRNYSANIERTLFDIDGQPDIVVACEIIEHLVRSPHIMLLNVNKWLPLGGKLLMTTPNGAQFANPLRRKSQSPHFRSSVYSRHNHLFTQHQLFDLVELCGFSVREGGCCNVYRRRGMSAAYAALAHMPGRFWREKFCQTVYVVAEKTNDVTVLPRHPVVYDARGKWEFIDVPTAMPRVDSAK